MKSIEVISQNYLCTNCGACKAVCPKGSISFVYSNIGRMYAKVNHDLCVECGLCQRVCPSLNFEELFLRNEDPFNGTILNTYIVRSSDSTIYDNAQSGGMCTTTIRYLFDKKLIDAAIVCLTEISNNPVPKAIVVRSAGQLKLTQKSNYTPVEMLSVLKEIDVSERVALVGLPCHIKASVLLAERIKKYNVIKYRLGLVCDRTLCNGINDVIASLSKLPKYKVVWRRKNFTFRGRYYSYKNAPIVIVDGSNQERIIYPNNYRMVLKDMFTAPHCRICYDKANVFSDIAYGDPWCLDEVDWNKGDSLVITRTEMGDRVMSNLIKEGFAANPRQTDTQKALDGQFIYEREEQFPLYINAFRLSQSSEIVDKIFRIVPSREGSFIEFAKNEFNQFKKDEVLPKEIIIKKARSIIKTEKRKMFIDRCKSGIKKLIRIIIKK